MARKKNPTATSAKKTKAKTSPSSAEVVRAVSRIRAKAARSGLADMELDELDREIAAARAERRARRARG